MKQNDMESLIQSLRYFLIFYLLLSTSTSLTGNTSEYSLSAHLCKTRMSDSMVSGALSAQYFALGCQSEGFTGYFHPARWLDSEHLEPGFSNLPTLWGVSSSGQLTALANSLHASFSLLVPVDGQLSFAWEWLSFATPSELPDTAPFNFSINGYEQPLAVANRRYTSPLLRRGDRVTFQLLAGASHSIVIREYQFLSNAMGVIEQTADSSWADDLSCAHISPIENITAIVIPPKVEVYLRDFSQLELAIQPDILGQPYLDADGDEQTQDDQLPLLELETNLDIFWEDHFTYEIEGNTLIIRQWSIYDHCAGNELRQQQLLYCYASSYLDKD
jgi:hypothetical protein